MGIPREAYLNLLDKQPKHRGKPERDIQLEIIKYLRAKGYACGKTKTVGARIGNKFIYDPYTFRGKCDLEAFSPNGIMYGIEVKSKIGILSDYQKDYKKLFHNPPHRIYIEAHSLEDVIERVCELV